MKNWVTWLLLAWFLISSIQLLGIYLNLHEIKGDVSSMQSDVNDVRNDVRDELCVPEYEFKAPSKPLPSQ